jgi:uncharacterized protein YifE (UPF0438 family)
MSHFTPESGDYDWKLIKDTIDQSDIFLLLVGDGYGELSDSGESYIHREAVYAKSKHKAVVALLKNADLKQLLPQNVERLRSLHRLMMSGTFKYWSTKEDLLLILRQVLREHLKPQLGLKSGKVEPIVTQKIEQAITDTLFEMKQYPMSFSGKVFAHGNCTDVSVSVKLTWDTAFLNLGSIMTSPVTEDRMRSVLQDYVEENYRDAFMDKVAQAHALADVRCKELEFQRLKAYLKGAGVIENVAAEHGGIRKYWQLTQAGENRLHKLLLPS